LENALIHIEWFYEGFRLPDASGDQAVFDSRRPGLIFAEPY
jgi:hypothetical protein